MLANTLDALFEEESLKFVVLLVDAPHLLRIFGMAISFYRCPRAPPSGARRQSAGGAYALEGSTTRLAPSRCPSRELASHSYAELALPSSMLLARSHQPLRLLVHQFQWCDAGDCLALELFCLGRCR